MKIVMRIIGIINLICLFFCQASYAQTLRDRNLYEAAIDSSWAETVDTTCTYRVKTQGVSDQQNTGLCWLFSTLNVLRAEAMQTNPELGEFYFSFAYGQYWDLTEKCKHWLEMAERYSKEPQRSRMNDHLFKKPIGDGGHFLNAAHLIDKYGIVPLEVMPGAYSAHDNVTLMNTLRTLLRRYGVQYRNAPSREHESITKRAMADVKIVLDNMLGVPPETFLWRGTHWTPMSFRERYVRHDMENDYALLANDPSLPYYKVYEVSESRNCVEYGNWRFLNVPAAAMDSIGVSSLKGGDMFCISADTLHEGDADMGIYDCRLYDVKATLGVSLGMTKEEMALSCESRSVHAVAVCGVRLDTSGNAEQWLIENSFGTRRGWDGFVVMSAEWLDKYQWRCVVEKKYLPEVFTKLYSKRAKMLPAWYPLY